MSVLDVSVLPYNCVGVIGYVMFVIMLLCLCHYVCHMYHCVIFVSFMPCGCHVCHSPYMSHVLTQCMSYSSQCMSYHGCHVCHHVCHACHNAGHVWHNACHVMHNKCHVCHYAVMRVTIYVTYCHVCHNIRQMCRCHCVVCVVEDSP